MKRNSLRLMATVLLIIASLLANANPVDMRTAREVAMKFANANTRVPLRGAENLQLVTTYNISRGDAAFHIFNTPNGFVIVAADDCATPILGYSDEGRPFDLDNAPIQLQGYLQDFVEQIEYGIENNIQPDEATAQQWELVRATGRLNNNRDGEAVEPLVTAMWGQGCYYNEMCPEFPDGDCGHAKVGCVATAMGMIMHYWGYPISGTGYTQEGYLVPPLHFDETTYDWDNMPEQLTEYSSPDEIVAVSTLLWHCGAASYTMYGAHESGAYVYYVPEALKNFFGYSEGLFGADRHFNTEDWEFKMKSNLVLGQPLFYSGNDDNGSGSHAWICDGFNSDNLFHFNWGWYGIDNGYFSLSAVDVSGYYFNHRQYVVFDIYPQNDQSATYQITTHVNASNEGVASGGGEFSCGQICNLIATANEGYVFLNWTENGEVVSNETNYSFTVYRNRELTANFESSSTFYIDANAYPENGGVVSGGGTYDYGQTCTLSAIANEDYEFLYWKENSMIVSTESEYAFTVTNSRNLTACFEETGETCNVVLEIYSNDGHSWGEVALVMVYEDGTSESFTSEAGSSYTSFTRSVVNGSHITLMYYQPTTVWTGEYSISVSYANGVPIWQLCNYGVNDQMEFDVDCEGAYSPKTINVLVSPIEGGNANGGGTYEAGATCILTAIPNAGYSFVGWTENDEIVSTESMYLFDAYEDRTLTANFSLPFNINASAYPEEGGLVSLESGTFIYGQLCTLTATANEGYTFYNWTEDGEVVSWDAEYSFRVTAERDLVANFVLPFSITASPNTEIGGVVNGAGLFSFGQTCTITATASEGYMFTKWTEDGVVVSTEAEYTFTVMGERSLVAHFVEVGTTCNIVLEMSCSLGGWADNALMLDYGDGTIEYFTVDILYAEYTRAITDGNHLSLYWMNSGNYISDCSYTIHYEEGPIIYQGTNGYDDDFVLLYEFDLDCIGAYAPRAISVAASPIEGGFVSGGGIYEIGSICTLTASPNDDYTFVKWLEDGNIVSSDAEYSFVVTSDRELTACFAESENVCNVVFEFTCDWAFGSENHVFVVNYDDGTSEYLDIDLEEGGTVSFSRNILQSSQVAIAWKTAWSWSGDCVVKLYYENGETIFQGSYLSHDMPSEFVVDCGAIPPTYLITVLTNLEPGGALTGAGTYSHGAIATLTAIPNEGYIFLNWTKDGEIVSTEASYTFTVTENATFVANFGMSTSIELAEGWTWYAPTVQTSIESIQSSLGNNLELIQAKEGPASGDIVAGEMYKIQTTAPCTLAVTGVPITSATVTINPGENWFGFVGTTKTVVAAFTGFTPAAGDKVISQDEGFAVYENGAWSGTLVNLQPGKGYVYISNDTEPKTLVIGE